MVQTGTKKNMGGVDFSVLVGVDFWASSGQSITKVPTLRRAIWGF